jgi:hypothetical protein
MRMSIKVYIWPSEESNSRISTKLSYLGVLLRLVDKSKIWLK